MTLADALTGAYRWADAHAQAILFMGALIPVLGLALVAAGKRGQSQEDGKAIASALVGLALLGVGLEIAAAALAHFTFGRSVLDASLALLAAPVVCLLGALVGVRRLYPLGELGSVKTAQDAGALVLVLCALAWFFSKFRGWGLLFFGDLLQLLALGVVVALFVRRLFVRATQGARVELPPS